MESARAVWDNERGLAEIGIAWVIAWELLVWLLLVPVLVSEPTRPAFYSDGLVLGSVAWAMISLGGTTPAFVLSLRARQLRKAARADAS